MARALALCCLAACSSPQGPPAQPIGHVAAQDEVHDASRVEIAPRQPHNERELQSLLASIGPTELPFLISGPLLVTDLSTGATTTLCANAAEQSAREWGRKLVDPQRMEVDCIVHLWRPPHLDCRQLDGDEMLELMFAGKDAPRLVGAILSSPPAQLSGSKLISAEAQLVAQLATASCP